jgi:hypothetical protein
VQVRTTWILRAPFDCVKDLAGLRILLNIDNGYIHDAGIRAAACDTRFNKFTRREITKSQCW